MGEYTVDNNYDDDSGFFHSGGESYHEHHPSSPSRIKICVDDLTESDKDKSNGNNNMKVKMLDNDRPMRDCSHNFDIWDEPRQESRHVCYDADDENDKNLRVEKCLSSTEEDLLFRFCQDNQGTVYTMDRAISIIREKPKLTKRFFDHSSYYSSSDESEFEIIESSESYVHDKNCSRKCSLLKIPNLTLCSHCETDEEDIEILSFHLPQNGLKLGKVRSLPNIRFPLRRIKKRKKSIRNKNEKQSDRDSSSHSSQDSYYSNNSQRVSLRVSSETSENEEMQTNSVHRQKKFSLQELHDRLNSAETDCWYKFQKDIFLEREKIRASTFCHTSTNTTGGQKTGRFRIYSVPEVQNKSDMKNTVFPSLKDVFLNNNNNNNDGYTKEKEHRVFDEPFRYENSYLIIEI